MSALLGILLAATPAPFEPPAPWAEFSRQGVRNGITETVTIFSSTEVVPGRTEYRLSLARRTPTGDQYMSATSVECPAARAVIGSLRDLPMPRFAPYGFDGENRTRVFGESYYSLRAPANSPATWMTITSTGDAPVGKWIDKAFADLSGCWKT